MLKGPPNSWGLLLTSVADGVQPGVNYGTLITPGTSNAYGSYTSLMAGAAVTDDCYLLEIVVCRAERTATNRGMLVTIGFDPAGGTSFGGLGGVTGNEISNLLVSGAAPWYQSTYIGGAHRFLFPVFVKAGTSIGAKAQTNEATAQFVFVACNLWGRPSRPELVKAGSFVRTFGANTTTTDGVSVTCGTASEGSWTEIGTAADDLWWLEVGMGSRAATQTTGALVHCDFSVGDATNKATVLRDLQFLTWDAEYSSRTIVAGRPVIIANGQKIYGRGQAAASPSGFSMTAYCVGG